ncbi:hypothetical protein LD125_00365 [Mesoplasma sp. JKS002658]|uniref:MOLPALP family lipoprotein n=1 Tax=Mesoplasma whartonense TaxID=2878854 RepID=UPI002022B20D|nr:MULTISPECIES: MOLPALP family lipoprotein [unclassified Mesoplasma]MCL8211131.1 hypothetical protein [Mesoplasma sp. JKS002664]MCL8211792.1 hypothetical protein [Mesoplasma sp. JKS002662]MCL8214103.1 hypothetical protein [Mesoplasma sp. JKS002658]MCL8214469.1 hypothetical protein [Mesoplasma sp. JKS002663]MCL8215422.1 hypothetical protein [Mesoplasma sp. JKS002659]
MRRLLVCLSAVILTIAPTTTIISCSYKQDQKKVVQNQTKIYSQITAEALKSAVLFDQNFTINNQKNTSIDVNFTSNHYSDALIKDVFPKLISENSNIAISPDAQVAELYKMAFGSNQGGFNYNFTYSVANGSLTNSGVKTNTKLSTYIANPNDNGIVQSAPNSDITKTLGAITGGLNIVLGNDFTSDTAGLINGIINTPVVANILEPYLHPQTEQQTKISQTINLILGVLNSDKNTQAIDEVLSAITQENIDSNTTTQTVLNQATQDLFLSLVYFLDHKQINVDKMNEQNLSASEIFFDLLLKVDPGDVFSTDSNEDDSADYHLEISYGAKILNFVNVLTTYLGAFDEFKTFKPISYNYLFSSHKTNGQIIDQILNQPYKSDSRMWYKEKNSPTLYALINLQNIISDLQLYLSPDSQHDYQGLNTLKFFTILLGRGAVEGNSDQFYQAPIRGALIENGLAPAIKNWLKSKIPAAIEPYLDQFGLTGILDKSDEIIANIFNTIIDGILTNSDLTTTFNGPLDGAGLLLNLIPQLTGQIDNIIAQLQKLLLDPLGITLDQATIDKIKSAIESFNQIVLKLKASVGYLSTSGQASLKRPWDALYNGTFIADILTSLNGIIDIDNNTLQAIKKIGNIKNLLTSKLSSLFTTLNLSMPDFLYNLNNLSIADLIDGLATTFNTTRYQTLEANNQYFINSLDIKQLLTTLLPSTNSESQVLKDGVPVSVLELLLYTIVDGGKELTNTDLAQDYALLKKYQVTRITQTGSVNVPIFTTSGTSVKLNTNLLNALLGLETTTQPNYFYKETLYYAFARFYGHYYDNADSSYNSWFENTNGNVAQMRALPTKVLELAKKFSAFANQSIDQLITDRYQKYLLRGNFGLDQVKSTNLDSKKGYGTMQTLTYRLSYKNPDDHKVYYYQVKWTRPAFLDPNSGGTGLDGIGWRLVELNRQD